MSVETLAETYRMTRTRWLTAIIALVFGALLAGCGQRSAPQGSWEAYADAVDRHVETYVRFNEPDLAMQEEILADYEKAKQYRDSYHRTGTIPEDDLVEVLFDGNNERPLRRHVAVLLADDPSLECPSLSIDKPAGAAGHFIVIGGSTEFWNDRDPSAKFVSATLTLPEAENSLTVESQSWSPGKIIVAFAAGVVISLTGCDDESSSGGGGGGDTPAPEICDTTGPPDRVGNRETLGEKCSGSRRCGSNGTCTTSTSINGQDIVVFRCDCDE